jgi:Tol biopolymer transport system component
MGIYQRCLENFDETPVMINEMSEGNCINCHTFNRNNSQTMLFHMRQKLPGTIIYRNGKLSKVNTKTTQTGSPGIYPAWHPGGRYIVFSVDHIYQLFLPSGNKLREAFDGASDLVLYDTETNMESNCAVIATRERVETFPTWSPDGRYLYFCSAKTVPIEKFNQAKFDLLRISFNAANHQFGTVVDTIVSSSQTGLSVSFPRISPDGKFILFCMSSYGSFTIWHSDSDLYLKNLETGAISKPDINSNFSESYHSWSSNGRWIVFSSKRGDGFTTELYISYCDSNGNADKPFILPQKDPDFYKTFLRSYNIPELVTSAVKLNPRNLSEVAESEPVNALFDTIK